MTQARQGVFSFATTRRTQEIGIRMALDADRSEGIWMVLRQACKLTIICIGIGVPLVLLAGRFAKTQFYHTSQYDPTIFVVVIVAVPLLAMAGTWLPARRAAAGASRTLEILETD